MDQAGKEVVLVVEDDDATRDVLGLALTAEGFDVVGACDGQAAWEALDAARPDLIILDLHMPHVDGLAFVDQLHRHEEWRSIPVLITSAEPRLEQGVQGHGVDGILAKPFDLDDLVHRVREVIAR